MFDSLEGEKKKRQGSVPKFTCGRDKGVKVVVNSRISKADRLGMELSKKSYTWSSIPAFNMTFYFLFMSA